MSIDGTYSIPPSQLRSIEQPVDKSRSKPKTLRHSKQSVRRLAELGFDPLEEMVLLYRETHTELHELRSLKSAPEVLPNGDVRRYSSMADAAFVATLQKVNTDLMRYAYARVPEGSAPPAEIPQLVINLTPKDGVFVPSDGDEYTFVPPVAGDDED